MIHGAWGTYAVVDENTHYAGCRALFTFNAIPKAKEGKNSRSP